MEINSENIRVLLDHLPVKRLRAEVILEELVASGFCTQQDLVIGSQSSSAYFYERDISEIEKIFNTYNGRSWFRVSTPRDGFYDGLPEGLFHKSTGRIKKDREWDEIRLADIRQEQDARLFFSPFDNALNHQRIGIERFEKKVLEGHDPNFLKEFLTIFWPQENELQLSKDQQFDLFQLTIIAHKVAGNIAWMQECFHQMLGDSVKIFFEDVFFDIPVKAEFAPLGKALLGVNSILAPSFFSKWRRLKIQLGPLSYNDMSKYFPMGKGEKLIKFLCDLLVPAEIDWQIDLLPLGSAGVGMDAGDTPVLFSLNEVDNCAVLGYTTVL